MGWLNRIPPVHECVKPSPFEAEAGSIWQCDDCKKRWRVTVDVGGGQRRGDHHWLEVINPTDLPKAPVSASGTSSPRRVGRIDCLTCGTNDVTINHVQNCRGRGVIIDIEDIVLAYRGDGPEIRVSTPASKRYSEVHISKGLILAHGPEAPGALE